MADEAPGGQPGPARFNAPVPRLDARGPLLAVAGLAGVATVIWWQRRRQRRADDGPPGQVMDAKNRSRADHWLRTGAAMTGALLVRHWGRAATGRPPKLARRLLAWASHAQPLLPGDRAWPGPMGAPGRAWARPFGRVNRPPVVAMAALGGMALLPLLRFVAGDHARFRPDAAGGAGRGRVAGARRLLAGSAALLALSVLADSGMEHYRASFRNPAMYTPLVWASLSILANLHAIGGSARGGTARDAVHFGSGAVGVIGLGFHLYNIRKRPGGYKWINFFYGAPFGAPAAMALAGAIGWSAERLDSGRPVSEQRLLGLPFGRALSALVAAGLAGTVAEVWLLHFRGAFHDPFMWLPVTLPPVASLLMANAALQPSGALLGATRTWLWATALLGMVGVGFHAYGISRNMGGWRNWRQNILAGPPLPAPPSFSALSLAGLAALGLTVLPSQDLR